jgi:hypothetical protein
VGCYRPGGKDEALTLVLSSPGRKDETCTVEESAWLSFTDGQAVWLDISQYLAIVDCAGLRAR